MAKLDKTQLSSIMPKAELDRWLGPLITAMAEWEVGSPSRMAAFLAQVAHESSELTQLEENLRYTAKRLRVVWPKRFPSLTAANPYANNPERLANLVYAGRLGNGDEQSGDGWKYRGRGLLQITGKSNYRSAKNALAVDVVRSPERLREPDLAARSAAWYWASHGLNELADHDDKTDDAEDFVKITVAINGGKAGLKERLEYWRRARQALGA